MKQILDISIRVFIVLFAILVSYCKKEKVNDSIEKCKNFSSVLYEPTKKFNPVIRMNSQGPQIDSTITFDIDIDRDSITDLRFLFWYGQDQRIDSRWNHGVGRINVNSTDSIYQVSSKNGWVILSYHYNDTISDNSVWTFGGDLYADQGGISWPIDESYMAFRRKKDNACNYGWIKVSFQKPLTFSILGYGYSKCNGIEILAGEN